MEKEIIDDIISHAQIHSVCNVKSSIQFAVGRYADERRKRRYGQGETCYTIDPLIDDMLQGVRVGDLLSYTKQCVSSILFKQKTHKSGSLAHKRSLSSDKGRSGEGETMRKNGNGKDMDIGIGVVEDGDVMNDLEEHTDDSESSSESGADLDCVENVGGDNRLDNMCGFMPSPPMRDRYPNIMCSLPSPLPLSSSKLCYPPPYPYPYISFPSLLMKNAKSVKAEEKEKEKENGQERVHTYGRRRNGCGCG